MSGLLLLSNVVEVKGKSILRELVALAFLKVLCMLNTITIYKEHTCNVYSTSSARTVLGRKMQIRL